jgi:hypothetical protein
MATASAAYSCKQSALNKRDLIATICLCDDPVRVLGFELRNSALAAITPVAA